VEKELSNTLIVSNLGPDINLQILEEVFHEKCLEFQTSMPEDIRYIESLKTAYIIFPSIPVSTKVLEVFNNLIIIVNRRIHIHQRKLLPN
jgi:hypothetical protein